MFNSTLKRAQLGAGLLHLTRLCLLLLLTFTLSTVTADAQSDKDIHPLELHKPVERVLAGGLSHSYRVVLAAGQYLRVVADQRGIDVVVTLFDPDNKPVVEIDSPNGTQGPEPLSAIAETSGAYRLEVRSLEKDAPAGRYEVKLDELRTATEKDRGRIAAQQTLIDAERLFQEGTAESLRSAIGKYEDSLSLFRSVEEHAREPEILNSIGILYKTLGDTRKALDYYMRALPLFRKAGDSNGEAVLLQNIGRVYFALGERQKALDFYGQALPLLRKAGDRANEAMTLNGIGLVYSSSGEMHKALDQYEQSLQLTRALNDGAGEAKTLNEIGIVHDSLGNKQEALKYYSKALPLLRAAGARSEEATTLSNIGLAYHSLGEMQKALEYFTQALPLKHAAGDRRGEATTFHNMGLVYQSLGDKRKALDYYERALPVRREVGDRSGEAVTLNNIAGVYNSLGENIKAQDYYNQALQLTREIAEPGGEATVLHNIGLLYYSLRDKQKALAYYTQALPLRRSVGDRNGEATTLRNIAAIYNDLGDKQKALAHFVHALYLSRACGDRVGEASLLNNLMFVYRSLNNPRLAIHFGKESANLYQHLRSNIHDLDKDLQKTYLKSVEHTYRALAQILIEQGRPAEAQQVLNAFKDQQYFDFDRAQAAKLTPLARTPREGEFVVRYEEAVEALGAISGQVAELKRKSGVRGPAAAEAGQLRQLKAQLATASDEFAVLLKQAEAEFSKPADGKDGVGDVSDTSRMQAVLRQLKKETGRTSVVVYTVVGEMKFHALIVTADHITSVSSTVRGDELNRKARELWGLLQSDLYDPTKVSHDLYNLVFRPVEERLPKDTQTIMWSLDGNLRYVPMAALYDGRQYLVERYNHVNFTRAETERMTRVGARNWTATALGTSAAHTVELLGNKITFSDLPGVGQELSLLVKQKDNPHGIFEGETLEDAQFTKEAMLSALRRKRPLVHIASHFSFRPGDEQRSFLLVGDGTALTLAEMKQQGRLFDGVEMLTLSACNTAAQLAGADGREIDAFAELAQRLGANAVMATLWPVADSSTPWLMREFYRTRRIQTLNKAEALRQAQLSLLKGRAGASPSTTTKSAMRKVQVLTDNADMQTGNNTRSELVFVDAKNAVPFKKDPSKPFSHPYYWSPFILIGNWR